MEGRQALKINRPFLSSLNRSIALIFLVSVGLSAAFHVEIARCEEVTEPGRGDRTLYLVRHGQYDQEDERDPDIGRGLVPLGMAQARLVASRLRALPVEMTSLHSSTMTRARETALIIGEEFPGLSLQQSALIRECTPPTWREDIMGDQDPAEAMDCTENLEKAFDLFFTPSPDHDRHDIIVCHGNVIRWFVTKVLKVDPLAWLGMSIGNCSLTVVKVKPDGAMKLLFYGDVGHIPPNMQTGLEREERKLAVPETVL